MMTHAEYRDALDRLGLTQVGAARLLKIGERTSRRYAAHDEMAGDIPGTVELLLRKLLEEKGRKK